MKKYSLNPEDLYIQHQHFLELSVYANSNPDSYILGEKIYRKLRQLETIVNQACENYRQGLVKSEDWKIFEEYVNYNMLAIFKIEKSLFGFMIDIKSPKYSLKIHSGFLSNERLVRDEKGNGVLVPKFELEDEVKIKSFKDWNFDVNGDIRYTSCNFLNPTLLFRVGFLFPIWEVSPFFKDKKFPSLIFGNLVFSLYLCAVSSIMD